MADFAAGSESADWEAAAWFFEHAADAFVAVEGGLVRRANPAWVTLTGWTAEETVGRLFTDFLAPEALHAEARLGAEAGVSYGQELQLVGKTGRLWVRAKSTRSADGRALVAMHDITLERRREAAATQSRRVAKLLGDAAGITVYRYDAVADLAEAAALLPDPRGRPGEALTREVWRARIHPDDVEVVDAAWERTRRSGRLTSVEYRRRTDAGWRRLRVSWQGLAKRHTGDWDVLAISQDVTELADACDAALAAAAAKSQFLANLSHEIRTPMNGLLGVLHVLRGKGLAPADCAMVEEALACGATLSQLLDDIIDFSKVEAGQVEFSPEPVELSAMLDAAAGMVRSAAESRGLRLACEAPESAGWAMLDSVRLRQMLFNLLGNAVKFTEQGGVTLRLTKRYAGARQRVRIEVEDTGIGIPQAMQPRLFERFEQGDGSTTRRHGGLGLGLAVTKLLAEQMGGRIGFRSREGAGSIFWIEV
ncbi:MAG: ATP-binding protein, partial [Phenylobacterium sp.]